jgi:hypothetical protein
VPLDALVIGEEHEPLAVGRGVWEPVGVTVVGNSFLVAAIRSHPPNLHVAGSNRVEVNAPAVGREIRPIVETGRIRQALLLSTLDRNGVDIKVPVALGAVSQSLAIRRPAMAVRGAQGRDPPGFAARAGKDVDQRIVLRRVADRQPLPIGREDMVVVTVDRASGVQLAWLAAICRNRIETAAAVEDERISVARPVRSLEALLCFIDDAAFRAVRSDDLQTALHRSVFVAGGRRATQDVNLGESRSLQSLGVVRTHRQADVDGVTKLDGGRPDRLEFPIGPGDEECERVAMPFEAQSLRRGDRGADFESRFARLLSVL